MKILIATGLGKSDIGGPAQYGLELKREFEKLGHEVRIAQFGSVESALLRIWPATIWADACLALDTFSVGMPSVLAGKIFGKKVIVRVGGDFLWSAYVNRTGEALTLPKFYERVPELNVKEKLMRIFMRWTIEYADYLAFNTEWQRSIWSRHYGISESKTGVVRNFIPKYEGLAFTKRNFLWAGRLIPEKNSETMKMLGIDIVTGETHEKVLEKIRNCHAVVSLAFTDICPNFIIEGASLGKPFVMTRETGLNEIFPKGGTFVDPLNEAEIKKAMEALQDENTYNKNVNELKSLNLSHSWVEIANEFLNIWRKCP